MITLHMILRELRHAVHRGLYCQETRGAYLIFTDPRDETNERGSN